jgi:hypothetical protein
VLRDKITGPGQKAKLTSRRSGRSPAEPQFSVEKKQEDSPEVTVHERAKDGTEEIENRTVKKLKNLWILKNNSGETHFRSPVTYFLV